MLLLVPSARVHSVLFHAQAMTSYPTAYDLLLAVIVGLALAWATWHLAKAIDGFFPPKR